MNIRRHLALIVLVVIAVTVRILSLFPQTVETYYSDGLYPIISKTQRTITKWVPFSVGDILYFLAGLYLLIKTIRIIRLLIGRRFNKQYFLHIGKKVVSIALLVYILFNVLWGLNYNRIGIAKQLVLTREEVSVTDLMDVMQQVVHRVNELDSSARKNREALYSKRKLFDGSIASYKNLAAQNSLFVYSATSVKPSLYSYLGNYMGFTGYYNPFSGEAQVNTTVPVFIQPFTTCHEIGHQLGYAKESEANFAGYLAASASDDPAFRYSAYFDIYLYGRRYVYLLDSIKGKQLDSLLKPGVRNDIRELREFGRRHANPIERLIDLLYGEFLKANQQPSGRVSYSEVIVWIIAYYKKYGRV